MSEQSPSTDENQVVRFEQLIRRIDSQSWGWMLYLSGHHPWNAQSEGAVFDPEESEDSDDDPKAAKRLGLTRALSVADAQDVVANIKGQIPEPSVDDLIKAFNFYYSNDAFIRV